MPGYRFQDSLIYWRVVPIGLATAFVSGVIASLVTSAAIVMIGEIKILDVGRHALAWGGAALIAGVVLWLPLSLVWHIAVICLRDRLGLYRAAMMTSAAFGVVIVLAAALLSLTPSVFIEWRLTLSLIWGGGTIFVALGLTHLGFRQNAGAVLMQTSLPMDATSKAARSSK